METKTAKFGHPTYYKWVKEGREGRKMPKAPTAAKTKIGARSATPGRKKSGNPGDVPLIRVNFDITREEHTKLKIYAAKNGVSMADILRSFVTKIKLTNIK
jgi:hypothetical protein